MRASAASHSDIPQRITFPGAIRGILLLFLLPLLYLSKYLVMRLLVYWQQKGQRAAHFSVILQRVAFFTHTTCHVTRLARPAEISALATNSNASIPPSLLSIASSLSIFSFAASS